MSTFTRLDKIAQNMKGGNSDRIRKLMDIARAAGKHRGLAYGTITFTSKASFWAHQLGASSVKRTSEK
jgi:hypothetical protein